MTNDWATNAREVIEYMQDRQTKRVGEMPSMFWADYKAIQGIFMEYHPNATPEAFAAWFANHARSLGDGVYEVRLER